MAASKGSVVISNEAKDASSNSTHINDIFNISAHRDDETNRPASKVGRFVYSVEQSGRLGTLCEMLIKRDLLSEAEELSAQNCLKALVHSSERWSIMTAFKSASKKPIGDTSSGSEADLDASSSNSVSSAFSSSAIATPRPNKWVKKSLNEHLKKKRLSSTLLGIDEDVEQSPPSKRRRLKSLNEDEADQKLRDFLEEDEDEEEGEGDQEAETEEEVEAGEKQKQNDGQETEEEAGEEEELEDDCDAETASAMEVKAWLRKCGLHMYTNRLLKEGWNDMNDFDCLEDEDLKGMGFKAGHLRKFRKRFKQWKSESIV